MSLLSENLKGKNRRMRKISKYLIPGFIVLAMILIGVLAGVACGDKEASVAQGKVKATWIQTQVVDDTASISVEQVNNNKIVHFNIPVQNGNIAFMAYDLGGDLIVRANVCPPCRSVGFSLEEDRLICDTCGATFKADTGKGVTGACIDYPKASVSHEITGGNILMQVDDMLAAYMDTIEAG